MIGLAGFHYSQPQDESALLEFGNRVAEDLAQNEVASRLTTAIQNELSFARDSLNKESGQSGWQRRRRLVERIEQLRERSSVHTPSAQFADIGMRIGRIRQQHPELQQRLTVRERDIPLPPKVSMLRRYRPLLQERTWQAVASVLDEHVFDDVLVEMLSALVRFGPIELSYGAVHGTCLVHLTAALSENGTVRYSQTRDLLDQFSKENAALLETLEGSIGLLPRQITWEAPQFPFVLFARVFAKLSCGRLEVLRGGDLDGSVLGFRLILPRQDVVPQLPRRRHHR
jgi:hypothetical protein